MQPYNPLIDVLCLVALVTFATSAIMGVALLRRPARFGHPTEPALMARVAMPPVNSNVSSPALPYAAIPTLLTRAEQQFFAALQAAVPDGLMICPQVRLANLVRPTARQRTQNQYDFYRIQAKCVDFVLCDRMTTAPRLVVELDDTSHERQDRKERDAFVDAVLATVRPMCQRARGSAAMMRCGWLPPFSRCLARTCAARRSHGRMTAAGPGRAHLRRAWQRSCRLACTTRYVCGTCQGAVRRESSYCHHCGALLARR